MTRLSSTSNLPITHLSSSRQQKARQAFPTKEILMHAQGFAIFFLLCLTGCSATPNKVRESPPRLFETTKSSESVVSCIIEKYDGMGMQKALEITPRGDGGKSVKVMVNPSTPTIRLLIDVAAVPGGAFTRSYENFAVAPFDREIIQACGTGKF